LSSTTVSIAARRITRPRYRGIARITLAAAVLVGGSQAADAQTTTPQNTAEAQPTGEQKPRWEFDIPTGTVVPTGAQRGAIKRGNLIAAQLSYVVRPELAITTTLGWARSHDISSVGEPKLDLFTYDAGAEVRAPRRISGHGITFSPFAGGGAGVRSYNYRNLDVDATHNVAAYVSAGGEFGIWRVRLRIEVRDYVTGFKPLGGGGTADARNDVVVMSGLRVCFRQACVK
jgi:hypothetical protein